MASSRNAMFMRLLVDSRFILLVVCFDGLESFVGGKNIILLKRKLTDDRTDLQKLKSGGVSI